MVLPKNVLYIYQFSQTAMLCIKLRGNHTQPFVWKDYLSEIKFISNDFSQMYKTIQLLASLFTSQIHLQASKWLKTHLCRHKRYYKCQAPQC